MQTVNVATLKQRLSKYLHAVEQGNEVVVTSHRRQIARLVPENNSGVTIRPPSLPLSTFASIRGVTPVKPVSAEKILLADRKAR